MSGDGKGYEGRPRLGHHYDSHAQQFESGKLGMWLFLVTEILLFGGLFCAYAIYRANHPEIFHYGHEYLDKTLGGINTLVLISSSLTMAWAVRAAQIGAQRLLVILLALTLLGGAGFMGIKYTEYKHKWEHGLLWGEHFDPEHTEEAEGGAAGQVVEDSEAALEESESEPMEAAAAEGLDAERSTIPNAPTGPRGLADAARHSAQAHDEHIEAPEKARLFFSWYFGMTGLHALHVLVGMGLIGWILVRSIRRDFGPAYFTPVDFVGLYWHLVDLIWIFLFPLLYLVE
jgi:cytochrome c oxidase subunit 3